MLTQICAGLCLRPPGLSVLTGLALASLTSAQAGSPTPPKDQALTAKEAVRLALDNPAFVGLLDGRIAALTSERDEAGLPPNPEIEFERESVDGIGDPSEITLLVGQTFDIAGQRRLKLRAAEQRLASGHSEAAREQTERTAQTLRRFYGVLHAEHALSALERWIRILRRTEGVVAKRVTAGEASGYDLKRVAQERVLAEMELADDRGTQALAWERLRALLGEPGKHFRKTAGTLLPPQLPALEALQARIVQRPDLLALQQRAEAAALERRAARRERIPSPRVGIGAKQLSEAGQNDTGLALALSIPVPLFDHGQTRAAKAQAQEAIARNQYRLALAEAEGELKGIWHRTHTLISTATRLQKNTVPAAKALGTTAQAAYQAGEVGVLELLDAYRGLLETERRALKVAHAARRSQIALLLTSGGTPE